MRTELLVRGGAVAGAAVGRPAVLGSRVGAGIFGALHWGAVVKKKDRDGCVINREETETPRFVLSLIFGFVFILPCFVLFLLCFVFFPYRLPYATPQKLSVSNLNMTGRNHLCMVRRLILRLCDSQFHRLREHALVLFNANRFPIRKKKKNNQSGCHCNCSSLPRVHPVPLRTSQVLQANPVVSGVSQTADHCARLVKARSAFIPSIALFYGMFLTWTTMAEKKLDSSARS